MNPLSRLRKHHAIEHATANVLFAKRGRPAGVLGLSDLGGFHLIGPYTPDEVRTAAKEALERLRKGERKLALTDLCGTNIVTTAAFATTAVLLAAGRARWSAYPTAVSAAILAIVASAPAGRWLQRTVTTDPTVKGLSVATVDELPHPGKGHHLRVRVTADGSDDEEHEPPPPRTPGRLRLRVHRERRMRLRVHRRTGSTP